ncbi:MAG: hypothetical protein JWM36_1883 [Hyphomicrobiales bacterium]|nr:hypothetical protein [Hyphomicrobiales bacterium]
MLKRPDTSVAELEAPSGPGGLGLHDVLHFLWRRWVFISIMGLLGLLFGWFQLSREVPRYQANVQILLDPRKEKASGNEAFLTDTTMDAAYIESQISTIRSKSLMQLVAQRENLTDDPEFGARGHAPGSPAAVAQTANNLLSALNAARLGQGYVIGITIVSLDPVKAARVANAIAETYAVYRQDRRLDSAKRASGWLGDRIQELRSQLRQSEEAVVAFRAEHKLLGAGPSVTLNQQQLTDVNGRLVAARAELADKRARYDVVNGRNARDLVANLPDVISQGALAGLRQQQVTLSQQEAELLARYSDRHPQVVNLRAQKREIERAMAVEVQRISDAIKSDYEMTRARVANLEKAVSQATGQTGADDATSIRLRELERTAAVNKSLFEDFLQRAKVTEEQATFDPRDFQVINPAQPIYAPMSPVPSRILGMGLLIGLAIGVGGALVFEKLNGAFTTPLQIESMLGLPLLTMVGRLGRKDLKVHGRRVSLPVFVTKKPLSRLSESIRAIRTSLRMSGRGGGCVIQICSSVPGEGKTTMALALAASFASSKLKVLFIDADLRLPTASKLVGGAGRLGLADYLNGDAKLEDITFVWEDINLPVIPAGSRTQRPADLLGSEQMAELIAHLRQSYDVVILDSSPIAPVVDGAVVSRFADRIVYVVRWASTSREVVQRALEQVDGQEKIAGVVFNLVNERRARKYGRRAMAQYSFDPSYARYYSE